MPGVITWGLGEGDAVGIFIPGVITCGLGEGDALGICIPGVITCGLGEGEGLGLAVFWLALLLARLVVFFFGAARLGFGFAAGGLGITCPSCCGNAVPLSANTSAKEQSVLTIFVLPDRFIIPPNSSLQIANIQIRK
jgi:hypothetical protein